MGFESPEKPPQPLSSALTYPLSFLPRPHYFFCPPCVLLTEFLNAITVLLELVNIPIFPLAVCLSHGISWTPVPHIPHLHPCALSQALPQQTGTSRSNHPSFSCSLSHPQAGNTISTTALQQKLQKPREKYSKSPLTAYSDYLHNWEWDTKKYSAKATKIPTREGTGREWRFSRETSPQLLFSPGRVKALPGPTCIPLLTPALLQQY